MSKPYPGTWIIIEGGDGYGKTEQERKLKQSLLSLEYPVVEEPVREPGGTVVGEQVREFLVKPEFSEYISPVSQVLGHNFARSVLIHSRISKLLEAGKIIISDRSWISTIAYQGFAEKANLPAVISICEFALSGYMPTHIFILDVSVEEARHRLKQRGEVLSFYDEKPVEFHQKVHEGYHWAAKRYKDIVTVVDGEKLIDEVAAEILARTLKIIEL